MPEVVRVLAQVNKFERAFTSTIWGVTGRANHTNYRTNFDEQFPLWSTDILRVMKLFGPTVGKSMSQVLLISHQRPQGHVTPRRFLKIQKVRGALPRKTTKPLQNSSCAKSRENLPETTSVRKPEFPCPQAYFPCHTFQLTFWTPK